MSAFAMTPLPLATVQTCPGGCVARRTEYTPPSGDDVSVNVKGPLEETESASVSLLMRTRSPPARPETVPPTEWEGEARPRASAIGAGHDAPINSRVSRRT